MNGKKSNKRRKSIVNKKNIKCGLCLDDIDGEIEEIVVECDICQKWFHSVCSGVDHSTLVSLVKNTKLPFHCNFCKPRNAVGPLQQTSSSQIQFLVDKMEEFSSIKKSFDLLYSSQAALQADLKIMFKEFASIRDENKDLKKRIESYEHRIKSYENSKLRTQLFFKSRNDSLDKDDPSKNVISIGVSVGVSIEKSDIKSAVIQERLSGKDSSIVKISFSNETVKYGFLKNRSKIRELYKDVSFFDVLSKENGELYRKAKELLKKGFSAVYHRAGKIFAKRTFEGKPIFIKNKSKVEELLSNTDDLPSHGVQFSKTKKNVDELRSAAQDFATPVSGTGNKFPARRSLASGTNIELS